MKHDEKTLSRWRWRFFGAAFFVGVVLSLAIAALFATSGDAFMVQNYTLITGVSIVAFWLVYVCAVCALIMAVGDS